MKCPFCGHTEDRVVDSRVGREGELGEVVMEHLQKLDQVAYVRFASVYRQFKDINQFMDEVKGLIKEGDKAKAGKPAPKPAVKK